MIDCNEWRTEKRHECANMGKVKRLELWWQLYRTSLPVWDLENFRPMDFCWHECTWTNSIKHWDQICRCTPTRKKKNVKFDTDLLAEGLCSRPRVLKTQEDGHNVKVNLKRKQSGWTLTFRIKITNQSGYNNLLSEVKIARGILSLQAWMRNNLQETRQECLCSHII